MDRIQAMQIFMRVAQAGSFVRAAETLSLPSSTVTSSIKIWRITSRCACLIERQGG